MEKNTLGRTGISVTAAGLGCGGFSRIGMENGAEYAAGIVRAAYDSGVNLFDTAAAYGTQTAVGLGLRGVSRSSYAISTKFSPTINDERITPGQMLESLEQSLRELETDYIDVFNIHGLRAEDYSWARDALYPGLYRAKEQGKIRFIGVTELFGSDMKHEMLMLALPEDLFDVVMVGYNILNPSAAKTVLPLAMEKNVGVQCMFAVRNSLQSKEALEKDIARIKSAGQAKEGLSAASLDFLTEEKIAANLPEAAYRFCRHTPGISVVLTGTGNHGHLKENLKSLELPALPKYALERLYDLFGGVDCVSGQ
jgi:L-galactose dehydrogenase